MRCSFLILVSISSAWLFAHSKEWRPTKLIGSSNHMHRIHDFDPQQGDLNRHLLGALGASVLRTFLFPLAGFPRFLCVGVKAQLPKFWEQGKGRQLEGCGPVTK